MYGLIRYAASNYKMRKYIKHNWCY